MRVSDRLEQSDYHALAAAATARLRKDATTQGITTALGMVFYDLRRPAYMIYPVNTPLRNSIPRSGDENGGTGTAAHWKAYVNPNATNNYAGVAEGQRNAFLSFQEKDYTAVYKELGQESFTTFTGQFAGQGFTDPMADSQAMVLNSIMLSEEAMTIGGNSSYPLGIAPTPSITAASGGFSNGATVSVAVVALTPHGWATSGANGVANGLTLTTTRNNADGTQDVVNGGCSAISAMSAVTTTSGGNGKLTAKCTAVKGAVAYAWFVNTTDSTSPSLANARIAAITNAPVYTFGAAAAGTQTGAATGMNADHSTNSLSFDGLLTFAAQSGIWNDLGGNKLTPQNDGTILEFEAILGQLWIAYQATIDKILVSSDQLNMVSQAILSGTGGNVSAFRFNLDAAQKGTIQGGSLVVSYLSKYTMGGAKTIPIEVHPGLPPGTIYFDISSNPYPHSKIKTIREYLTQRDYYSILYPIKTRRWEYGTYVHEVLAHRLPQLTAVISGAATA